MRSDAKQLAVALRRGDRRALARAITLVESKRAQDRVQANELIESLSPLCGNSIRIGISGAPGVGKSSLIEAVGNLVIDRGHKIAVLAVDPSSTRSGGSILGDKTRMETLSRRLEAFIRPSPAGDTLGGVARRTHETIRIVEAAGFDVVVVETVGVGQSETTVADITDMFLLLLQPGGGDELQGIKRGIVELADLIVVNKADGKLKTVAEKAAVEYRNAVGFLQARHQNWQVTVATCSAHTGEGLVELWTTIERYRKVILDSGQQQRIREYQAKAWLWREAAALLSERLREDNAVRAQVNMLESAVAAGQISPWAGAQELVTSFLDKGGKSS